MSGPVFQSLALDDLTIEDEASFRHVAIYDDLKQILRQASYRFRVLPPAYAGRWDRALLLNLTFWGASAGGDVLESATLPADVVAHVAWHHLAVRALGGAGERPTAEGLFLGEAIASAFDVYLVGRLLGHAPRSTFLETQVPAMADAAEAAGVSEDGFDALLQGVARDPERAFEDLRQLLFDVSTALLACPDADEALATLARFDAHRFAPLLHRYELSNWVLYARAHAPGALGPDPRARAIDAALREDAVALDSLQSRWVTPARREP
jgi:hypothetical protein